MAATEIFSGLWANEVQTVSTLTLHSVSSEPSFLVCFNRPLLGICHGSGQP